MHLVSPFERKVTEGLTNPDAQEHVPSASSIAFISPQDWHEYGSNGRTNVLLTVTGARNTRVPFGHRIHSLRERAKPVCSVSTSANFVLFAHTHSFDEIPNVVDPQAMHPDLSFLETVPEGHAKQVPEDDA